MKNKQLFIILSLFACQIVGSSLYAMDSQKQEETIEQETSEELEELQWRLEHFPNESVMADSSKDPQKLLEMTKDKELAGTWQNELKSLRNGLNEDAFLIRCLLERLTTEEQCALERICDLRSFELRDWLLGGNLSNCKVKGIPLKKVLQRMTVERDRQREEICKRQREEEREREEERKREAAKYQYSEAHVQKSVKEVKKKIDAFLYSDNQVQVMEGKRLAATVQNMFSENERFTRAVREQLDSRETEIFNIMLTTDHQRLIQRLIQFMNENRLYA